MNTETKSQIKDETNFLSNKNLLKPEFGNSSADECSTNKKKSKKRERSPAGENLLNELAFNPSSPQQASANQPSSNPTLKKEKQRPETWNKLEQQTFFNALRQNGKNFESITQCFNARQKRFKADDGVYVQRSKEQIRHFYYRTWHKIIKYISIPFLKNKNSTVTENSEPGTTATVSNESTASNVIKIDSSAVSIREIQVKCLIAFNVLMTKLHRWNKKSAIKLVELINQGSTTIREKGKVNRLKMPICKDLIKPVQQSEPEVILPEGKNPIPPTITIQLEPKNENAFCRVHRLAQTPFVNIDIQTSQSVKYLIEFLEKKWKNRRNQFIDKFQISRPIPAKVENPSSNETDQNSETNKFQKKNIGNPEIEFFTENLILYPNEEIHEIDNIDLAALSQSNDKHNDENDNACTKLPSILDEHDMIGSPPKIFDSKLASGKLPNKMNLVQQDFKDETMMIDDYTLIAAKNSCKDVKETKVPDQYQFEANTLRAGLTSLNSKIPTDKNTFTELSFTELYLALDKPEKIHFKYEWGSLDNSKQSHIKSICSNSASYESPLISSSLDLNKNQRQRFYIDTLASVAASFLKDIQVSQLNKKEISQANSNETSSNHQTAATTTEKSSKTQSNSSSKSLYASSQAKQPQIQQLTQKSPSKLSPQIQTVNQQPITVIPPVAQPKTTTDPIIKTVVATTDSIQQIRSEEQANKTKKLMSDLSLKRRSRPRKQIMIVNTSKQLPKLNLNMDLNQLSSQLNISPQSSNSVNDNSAQNIVFSGPVDAVARDIIPNNSSLISVTSNAINNHLSSINTNESYKTTQIESQSYKRTSDKIDNNQSNNILNQATLTEKSQMSSFQQALSSFMPNFMANLANNNSSSNSNLEENNEPQIKQIDEVNNQNDTLSDMSLLYLPINNTDSLFGSSVININLKNNENADTGVNNFLVEQKDTETQAIVNPCEMKGNINEPVQNNQIIGAFSRISNLKIEKNDLNIGLNLNNVIQTDLVEPSSRHTGILKSNNNEIQQPGFTLTYKKSDICEWTDSMADVSLTGTINGTLSGIFTDIQSPIKQSTITPNIYNENSNSIYISMDTIMEIMPQTNKFEDAPLKSPIECAATNLQN